MSHWSTQAPHEPSHTVTTSRPLDDCGKHTWDFQRPRCSSHGCSVAAVVEMGGPRCSLWTSDDAAVSAGVTYVHETATNRRD